MTALASRDVRLAARPSGLPASEHFVLGEAAAPEPGPGEIQVRNHWMSVDPYMRGRMIDRKSYVPPFQIGEILQGGAVGKVVASNAEGFAPGDLVFSMAGWREAFTAAPAAVMARKIAPSPLPEQAHLGVAGMPGLTAYAGLLRVGEAKSGDTVFVSAAAGAVGSVVCQIAKAKGCRVVGSAGGEKKVAFLKEIGVDAAIDYKAHRGAQALTQALRAAAPDGVDVYFENVGGDHFEAALNVMRDSGRIAMCGTIATYNDEAPEPGPSNLSLIIQKRLKVQGFIVSDHNDMMGDFARDITSWIGSGALTWKETVLEGVDRAPDAFIGLFTGENLGKMLVKLA